MSTLFETHRLSKRYGAKTVLKEVGLSVGPGHCVALLGHNGAGKTTLIKLLLGLTAPSAGQVSLLGQDPRGRQAGEVRRAIGYLPESVTFPPGMTGREIMRFYARLIVSSGQPVTVQPQPDRLGKAPPVVVTQLPTAYLKARAHVDRRRQLYSCAL